MALLGAAILAFEVLLTRIAAITLFANLAFAVIALSLFGLAVGSAWAERWAKRTAEEADAAIRWALLIAAIVTVASAVLATKLPLVPTEVFANGQLVTTFTTRRTAFEGDWSQANWGFIALLTLVQAIPFAMAGFVQALVLAQPQARVGVLYAFDLAGATVGSLSTLALLRLLGAIDALGCVAILFALSAIPGRVPLARAPRIALGVAMAMGVALVAFRPLEIVHAAGYAESDVLGVDWSSLARVALLKRNGDPLLVVDNTSATDVAFAGDKKFASNLERVPFSLRPQGEVLVIGAGGGQEIESALATAPDRKRHVDAIELADGEARLMRRFYGTRPDFLLTQPGVDYQIADGRSFLELTDRTWDVIQMKEVNFHSFAGQAASAWSPNLLFTVEAFRLDIAHLSPRGLLAITKGIYINNDVPSSLETISTLRAACDCDLGPRLAIVDRPLPSGGRQRLYLYSAQPFDAADLERLEEAVRAGQLVFRRTPRLAHPPFEATIAGEHLRTFPTDDRPFLSHRSDSPLLAIGGGVLVFLALLVCAGALFRAADRWTAAGHLTTCAALGVGFMFLEVVLVERTSLLLGHPTVAFVVVITALLCALGAGSLASERWRSEKTVKSACIAFFVATFAVALLSVSPIALATILRGRPWLVGALLFVGALPVGMLLPSVLRLARETGAVSAAGCWSVNAACSVVGTVGAALAVRKLGFRATSHAAWICYIGGLAIWVLQVMRRRAAPS